MSLGLIFREAIWTHHWPARSINLSKILHKAVSYCIDENLTKATLVYIGMNVKQIRWLYVINCMLFSLLVFSFSFPPTKTQFIRNSSSPTVAQHDYLLASDGRLVFWYISVVAFVDLTLRLGCANLSTQRKWNLLLLNVSRYLLNSGKSLPASSSVLCWGELALDRLYAFIEGLVLQII